MGRIALAPSILSADLPALLGAAPGMVRQGDHALATIKTKDMMKGPS